MSRRPTAPLLLVACSVLASIPAVGRPAVRGLTARTEPGRVLVSFGVSGALDDEALERIRSGLPVTLRYQIELVRARSFPVFVDKTLGTTRVETEVTYNSLTRQYSLRRVVDIGGRARRDGRPLEPERESTAAVEAMREWMTELRDIPVPAPDSPTGPLEVEVRCDLGRRFVWYLFPGRIQASAEQRIAP